ncbi:MAG: sigma-70 family RNA polymerase sigma factor, partial [Planctomycetota bacterium]|nr:sigma-70 family RNA polymerase sigma factor [Planctomycetota bacterium]
ACDDSTSHFGYKFQELFPPEPRRTFHTNHQTAVAKPDQDLIAECLRGQSHAFGDLVARYQNRLYNTLRNLLGSAEEAQDACQDTFLTAYQKLHTFGGRSAFYSWLFRIAFNTAVSRKRKRTRVLASIDAAREQSGDEPVDLREDLQPHVPMEIAERQQAVRAALDELSEEFRTVLVLKEMEGLKYEEIAEIVDCPIGTVRSRIHRAREELRQRLSSWMAEAEAL